MDLDLQNKAIIITGSAGGIGDGIVRVLSEEGAVVAIVGRSRENNFKLQNELEKSGGDIISIEAELGDPAACEKAVGAIIQKYGRIEGLVNNPGVHDDIGLGNYDRFMGNLHNNLADYYLLTHFALPYLKISRGAIVNISSKTEETGQGNSSSYAAANGGRNALTREWAVELLKYSIRVNAVIVTEGHMENRMSKSSEISHIVAFLLSEKSSHTTGQLVHVDGSYAHPDRALANA